MLDDPARLREHDPKDMLGLVRAFPHQFRVRPGADAIRPLEALPPSGRLWVAAMGGSAFAADMLASGLATSGVQVTVVRGYELPAAARPEEWLLAISYSGDTEETLSVYEAAGGRGLCRVALTSGGTLARLAARDGTPVLEVPGGYPPRAAAGFLYAAAAEVGHALAGQTTGSEEELEDPGLLAGTLAAAAAGWAPEVPEADNLAKRVARTLHGRLPVLYSGVGRPETAALRWRTQINENAKALCHTAALPEMNHNEIVGWESGAPGLAQAACLFLLTGDEHPRTRARLDITRAWLERLGGLTMEIQAVGRHPLEKLWWLAHLGDYVSVYLAALEGVDPTPVAAITALKQRLAEVPQ